MKKLVVTPEGTFELDLTTEEIAQRGKDAIQAEQDKIAEQNRIAQEKARKDSAIAKLKALGLTEEEVKSIL
jgi:fructose-1,6-bisphosphatase/sedoheptulose 1,7-bisphosphatase-like protein